MPIIVNPYDFKKEVCEALKLNPSEINKITITLVPDDFVHVDIVKHITKDEGKQFIKLLQKYELKEIQNILDVEEYYKDEIL